MRDIGVRSSGVLGPDIRFRGQEDFTTSHVLAEYSVVSMKALRKEFVSIESGEHFAVFRRSDQF